MKRKLLSVYCVSHFLVDLCCAFFMYSLVRQGGSWLYAVLIYNFCAFALQLPFGILSDRLNKNSVVAALGCVLVALSLFVPSLFAVAVMGIGNALFHVGGGIDVLNMSERKCAPLGLFVSPGAIGLCLGKMLCGKLPLYAAFIALLAVAVLILLTSRLEARSQSSGNSELSFPDFSPSLAVSVICLFSVVALRSLAGMSFSFEWSGTLPVLVSVGCVALGKALGGFAADFMGTKAASIVSLALCAVLFLFSSNAICGLAALLLFNMTMPITLWETAKIFPNAKGFSFGLLTFALFIGFLPVYFGLPSLSALLSAGAAVLSLVLLLFGIRGGRNAD